MALSPHLNTREFSKFSEVSGETCVNVRLANQLISESYNYIGVTYPSSSSEVYEFKTGGVSGTTIGTITLNYSDSTKTALTSVVRT